MVDLALVYPPGGFREHFNVRQAWTTRVQVVDCFSSYVQSIVAGRYAGALGLLEWSSTNTGLSVRLRPLWEYVAACNKIDSTPDQRCTGAPHTSRSCTPTPFRPTVHLFGGEPEVAGERHNFIRCALPALDNDSRDYRERTGALQSTRFIVIGEG